LENVQTKLEQRKSREAFGRKRNSYDVGYEDGRRAVVRSMGFKSERELKDFVRRHRGEEVA
jgi:hypothetical protein